MIATLFSPTSGDPLTPDGPRILTDGRERWPVLDGIPYLRTGRDELVRRVLADLDAGDDETALVRLLADQDDWWDGPAPGEGALRALIRDRDRLSLREAMAHLAYGRVGDYFAHRWSDPTFLAGLALVDAHWSAPNGAFELACGIGHYLRELAMRGIPVAGGDVVLSKLWLARHWVVGPEADLVCFDAGSPWPVAGRRYDLCLCQDAFYFLEPKAEILARLRAIGGSLAIGHIHNAEAANLSTGIGIGADELAAMFPRAVIYDDAELTRAAAGGYAPEPQPAEVLRAVEAFSLVELAPRAPAISPGPLRTPRAGATLRRNPLYAPSDSGDCEIAWPSERYRAEYAPRATFPLRTGLPEWPEAGVPSPEQARRREVVDLPARW